MTTLVTIENGSLQNFTLQDLDGNKFGIIGTLSRYRVQLNYSGSFNKVYHLVFGGTKFLIFALDITGQFTAASSNGQPFVLTISHDPNTFTGGNIQNLLQIAPQANPSASSPAYVQPSAPDAVYRQDFRG